LRVRLWVTARTALVTADVAGLEAGIALDYVGVDPVIAVESPKIRTSQSRSRI
jgi:hypothetical protein